MVGSSWLILLLVCLCGRAATGWLAGWPSLRLEVNITGRVQPPVPQRSPLKKPPLPWQGQRIPLCQAPPAVQPPCTLFHPTCSTTLSAAPALRHTRPPALPLSKNNSSQLCTTHAATDCSQLLPPTAANTPSCETRRAKPSPAKLSPAKHDSHPPPPTSFSGSCGSRCMARATLVSAASARTTTCARPARHGTFAARHDLQQRQESCLIYIPYHHLC